jgi:hypothetical protein
MTSERKPWASGPAELLAHGLSLLVEDSDRNRRLAMIAVDNAVELMIKTYLGLPERITGLRLSRKDYDEVAESFPKLLTALERYAVAKLDGLDLGEIEWYHRLRNELYHQGNGLTVERQKVVVYAELARVLFRNLYGFEVPVPGVHLHKQLGSFLSAWIRLERALAGLSEGHTGVMPRVAERIHAYNMSPSRFNAGGVFSKAELRELLAIRDLRNRVVHGEPSAEKELTDDLVSKLQEMAERVERLK